MPLPPTHDREEPLQASDLVLDRYRVQERVAAGGHSVIYRGEDERLERPVCIKAFHGLSEDEGVYATVLEHFVQEAFALSRLSHPNTLRIYDFGHLRRAGDAVVIPVQVSEYMGGGTLTSIVRAQGTLAIDEALGIVCKLGDALAEAHHAGIIHRDIKPQNILFTGGTGREPKLADFGIAKSAAAGGMHHQANETHIVAGFPLAMYSRSWAAPEQLCGEEASPAADIFSLALVAIFCMTGEVICSAGSAREGYEMRRDLTAKIAASLRGLRIAPEISEVLQAACAFDKTRRPSSSSDFVAALRNAHRNPLPPSAASAAPSELSSPLHLQPKSTSWAHAGPLRGTGTEPPSLRAEGTETTGVLSVPDPPRIATPAGEANVGLALQAAPIERGPSISLSRRQPKQHVGTRACEFLELGQVAVALQIGVARVELNSIPNPLSPSGQSLTLKGVSCFVAKAGGRPSRAVIISTDEYVDLVNPRNQLLARIRVSFGSLEGGRYYFQLGNSLIAVDAGECPNPVLIDSPIHHQSFLLYGVGQSTVGRAPQR